MISSFPFLFFFSLNERVMWRKQYITMSLFFPLECLCWAFLFISNCLPFFILVYAKTRLLTLPFVQRFFLMPVFVNTMCGCRHVGAFLIKTILRKCHWHFKAWELSFWANKYYFANICETFVLQCSPLESRQKHLMCTDIRFCNWRAALIQDGLHCEGDDCSFRSVGRLGFNPCFCPLNTT